MFQEYEADALLSLNSQTLIFQRKEGKREGSEVTSAVLNFWGFCQCKTCNFFICLGNIFTKVIAFPQNMLSL